MPHWIQFIEKYSNGIQLFLFAGILFICWNIENVAALATSYNKWTHAFVNARFIFTNIPVQFTLGILFTKTMFWTTSDHLGLVYLVHFGNHYLLMFLACFTFLDFGEYVYHVLMHKFRRLWLLHLVHHSDRNLDVSTTLREHPAENVIRLLFTLVMVIIGGVPFWVLAFRQIIQVFATLFAHMQYLLPESLDKLLSIVFITPNLHHVHHHNELPYTDSNYGDVLSIWDRMFGTMKRLPAKDLVYGVDNNVTADNNEKFASLIIAPFTRTPEID